MKKLFGFLMLICILVSSAAFGQIDTLWSRTWDGQYWDEARTVAVDDSGNMYVAGWTYQWGVNYDLDVLKYDAAGTLLWSRKVDVYSNDQAAKILLDNKGHVYVGGFVNGVYSTAGGNFALLKFSAGGDSLWYFFDSNTSVAQLKAMCFDHTGNILLAGSDGSSGTASTCVTEKIDTAGTLLWYNTYDNGGPNNSNRLYGLSVDQDDNVYVVGSCDDPVNFYQDIFTFKYRPNGDTAWMRQYNGPSNYFDNASRVLVDQQGNVTVGGTVNLHNPASSDIVLLRYDSSGTLLWSKFYDFKPASQSFDQLNEMKMDSQGNLYIAGYSSSDNSQATLRILVAKFDNNGDTIWTRRWGGSGDKIVSDLLQDKQGNLIIPGAYYNTSVFGYDALLLSYDASGTERFEAYYGTASNDEQEYYAAALDPQGQIIAVGRKAEPATSFDLLVVKYDNAHAGVEEQQPPTSGELLVYPVPVSSYATIAWKSTVAGNNRLELWDTNGRLVTVLLNDELSATENFCSFSAEKLASGIYMLRLHSGDQILSKKITVVH